MTNAIYARQSIDKADSISIESQIEFCKYELRGEPFEIFQDKGYSGKNIHGFSAAAASCAERENQTGDLL